MLPMQGQLLRVSCRVPSERNEVGCDEVVRMFTGKEAATGCKEWDEQMYE